MSHRDEADNFLDQAERRLVEKKRRPGGKPGPAVNGQPQGPAGAAPAAKGGPDSGGKPPSPPEVTTDDPAWPKPLDPVAFHGLAGEIVRAIEPHSEADPAALLTQVLVAAGNAIGRTAHFRVEGDTHFLNLFLVIVGQSSKARKGTSWGRVRQVFEAAVRSWLERVTGGLSSGEGFVHAIRDPVIQREPIKEKGRITGYQEVEVDAGEPDKRLLCVEEEYSSVLCMMGRQGNCLSQRLREAWQGRPVGSLTKGTQTRCKEPHLSLIGHVTADELRRSLTVTEMANGFGNRHLFVCAKRSKLLPHGSVWAPSQGLTNRLQATIEGAKSLGELKRDKQANRVWEGIYEPLSTGKPGMAGGLLGRAEAQVMRLAGLYAVLDQAKAIRQDHLIAASALWDYCVASVRFVFGDSLGDPVADEILAALRCNHDGLTRTDLSNLFGRNRGAEQISRALGLLLKHGLARPDRVKTSGRPVEKWVAMGKPSQPTR